MKQYVRWVAGVRSTEDGTIFTINHDSRPAPRSTGGNRRDGEHFNLRLNCRQLTPATHLLITSTDRVSKANGFNRFMNLSIINQARDFSRNEAMLHQSICNFDLQYPRHLNKGDDF